MFVFLADEENRIELPGRRAGRSGSFARGFFVWNSEVGKTTLGAGFFLFDYVCCNRIIWGADQYTEVRIRHTKGAPDRVARRSDARAAGILAGERQAGGPGDRRRAQQARRSQPRPVPRQPLRQAHGGADQGPETEEGRPIETLWDVTVAATAHACSVKNTDARLEIERTAGELLNLAA